MDNNENIKDVDILDLITKDMPDTANSSAGDAVVADNSSMQITPPAGSGASLTKDDLTDLIGLKGLFDGSSSSSNSGSGDVMSDLLNWLTDADKLPSDPLASFLSNSALKAEYGLFFMLLNNMSRIKQITEFLKETEKVIYDSQVIASLDNETLQQRYSDANKVMDNLIKHSRGIVYGLQKDKDKNKEMDKLQMLLSSIPTDKLKELIKSLR